MGIARQSDPRIAATALVPGGLAGRSVVVLGGTGFLGRHIHDAFGAVGARTLRVSRQAPDLPSPSGGNGAARLDLVGAEPRQLAALLVRAEAEVVVNAVGRAWQAGEAQMSQAHAGLVDRLVAALGLLPRPPRLIQLGTVHEYGPAASGTSIAEDHPALPCTAYGHSKLHGSHAVLRAAHTEGLDATVLRIANVCGPGAPGGSLLGTVADHLARLGAAPARRGGAVPSAELRLAPLRARRDFVDVRDVADAVLAAARAPAAHIAGEVINIGRGQAVAVRWLVERMIALSGLPVPVVEEERAGGSGVEWQQLDISRARLLLGWRPRRGLEESLADQLAALGAPHQGPAGERT